VYGVGVSRTPLSGETLNQRWSSVQRHKDFHKTREYKDYSVIGGYRPIDPANKSKTRRKDYNQMMPGYKRDSLSQVDMDYIMGAEWKDEFDCPNSTMVTNIKYDSKKMLMRVEFVNRGDIVVYDHVPADTYYYLKHCAAADNGRIGSIFWQSVRYPGQLIGSKFPFWYENKSNFFDNPAFANMTPEEREVFAQVEVGARTAEAAQGLDARKSTDEEKDVRAKVAFRRMGGMLDVPIPDLDSGLGEMKEDIRRDREKRMSPAERVENQARGLLAAAMDRIKQGRINGKTD
jgi:hypothetical protein